MGGLAAERRGQGGVLHDSGWWGRSYDVSPDGNRFLVIKEEAATAPSLVVVQHWDEELKRLAPRN